LSGNPLAELPASVCGLAALEQLDLVGCPISRLPPDIARLTNLERIVVADTMLDADEHAGIRAALPKVEIVGDPAPSAVDCKPYSMNATYAVGDLIAHPKFGAGTVRGVLADNRIDVQFHAGTKTLAHRRR
jgi:hypothetical protein